MKHLLEDAMREIVSLRRDNELMRAKLEVMDLFACVLHTKPAMRTEGASLDVAWALQKAIDGLDAKGAAVSPAPTFDRGGARNENNEGDLVTN